MPTIVIGDVNSDPRHPGIAGSSNPGGRPEAGAACAGQRDPVTPENADASCSAYWTMVGPDPPTRARTRWPRPTGRGGTESNLAGPNPGRLEVALDQGNGAGFTDRLDHVFLGHGAAATRAEVFGDEWLVTVGVSAGPSGAVWLLVILGGLPLGVALIRWAWP